MNGQKLRVSVSIFPFTHLRVARGVVRGYAESAVWFKSDACQASHRASYLHHVPGSVECTPSCPRFPLEQMPSTQRIFCGPISSLRREDIHILPSPAASVVRDKHAGFLLNIFAFDGNILGAAGVRVKQNAQQMIQDFPFSSRQLYCRYRQQVAVDRPRLGHQRVEEH